MGQTREVDLRDDKIRSTIVARSVSSEQSSIQLPMQNPIRAQGVADMITLDYLHEGAILYNIRNRFFHQMPYTYTGKICIAVNPYQWLNLYSTSIMEKFTTGDRTNKDPHVYATSMESYFHMKKHNHDQSILVSGESGAGKTETTKIVMAHIAKLSLNPENLDNNAVIDRIINANPLLESFGNAKTVRNDNSSRFGKFSELQFDAKGLLVGANSRTYLLEKSRVTKQNDGERNFHIFYQLLAVANDLPRLKLGPTYRYVLPDPTISNEEMMKQYQRTASALELIGIGPDLFAQMQNILAAILHLGETDFVAPGGDVDKSQLKDTKAMRIVSELLGVPLDEIEKALCNRNVVVGREVYLKPMTMDQATDCRDALAKALYARLFDWLVAQINTAIGAKGSRVSNFIGLLDIFGFEHFEHNSFEQLCINYANEKLQQKFVQDILKTVQAEYEEEGISWNHITFADNQDVLDLIEGRLGVLSLLNEESLLATGSDASFAHKLASVSIENDLIDTPRLNQQAFTIKHYAGTVTYDAIGFLDKHRDTLLPDLEAVMSKSSSSIVAKIFEAAPVPARNARSRRPGPKSSMMAATVGTQFKKSLAELMEKISDTEVHYIRCIKPNSLKSAKAFEHMSVVNQLRCAGVIEAIRVSRSAYPNRISHRDCLINYAILLPGGVRNMELYRNVDDTKATCEKLLSTLLPGGNLSDYQVGSSRVYFREGVLEQFEARRSDALRDRAVMIQKTMRGFIYRRKYVRMQRSLVIIQKSLRCFHHRRQFLIMKKGIVQLQARVRGRQGRKEVQEKKMFRKVSRMQACARQFLQRRKYLRHRAALIRIQSFWRMCISRLRYVKRLSAHRKHQLLGSKVARLQTRLEGGVKPPSASSSSATDRPSMVQRPSVTSANGLFNESAEVLRALQDENEMMRTELEKLRESNNTLKSENRKLREWQKAKEVDERVKTMAQRDQEAKDLVYLAALEKEFDKLRLFVCHSYSLPNESGSPPTDHRLKTAEKPEDGNKSSDLLKPLTNEELTEIEDYAITRDKAASLLNRCAHRLARAKTKTGKGSSRRVKDYWEEVKNFPPPMQYELGSVPWKRLLSDWAQGNPKKLDYMTRWLRNVLEGGKIENGPFPMGVELKSVTPMMLDGFMQLIIPKLNERADVIVHVHTKEFIGTSMRITLAVKEGVAPMKPRPLPSGTASRNLRANRALGNSPPPPPPASLAEDGWDRSSIRSVR